jgi:hypothetical protein
MGKKPKPKPYIHQSEQGDGDFPAEHRGQKFEKQVRTKEGDDGVIETHIDYKPRSTKRFFT